MRTDLMHTQEDSPAMKWMLRAVGLLLIAASLFFLYRDLTLSTASDWFFGASLGLGLVTFASSWAAQPRHAEARQRA